MNPLEFLLGRTPSRVAPQQLSPADRAASILRSAAPRATARAFPNEAAADVLRRIAPRATARAFPPATTAPVPSGGGGLFNPAVQVPEFFSRFGRSSSGLTLQRPASTPAPIRPSGGGFNPAVQIPALFSRFGRSSSGLTLGGGMPSSTPSVGTALGLGLSTAIIPSLQEGRNMLMDRLGVPRQVTDAIRAVDSAGNFATGLHSDLPGRVLSGIQSIQPGSNRPQSQPRQQITYIGANVPRLGQYGAPVTTDGSVPRPPAFTSATGAPTPASPASAPAARGGSVTPPSSSARSTPSPQRFSGGGSATFAPPAERAYTEEVSRTAQLTAQNPEMQRYEAARQADLKSGDFSNSEDIGMEMWARANPTLASKVKPGQAGYDTIQRVRQEAAQPGAGAFAATTPIFPGAQNFYSGQYQATPGATNPNVGAFTAQQTISSVPQNIGQFPFQATPMQTPGRPVTTQGFGSAPGVDTLGSFTRKQLSQDLLRKFAGL